MKPHGWDAGWYQHGESLWSVANKLAYMAAASVGDVLRLLAGVSYRGREAWLFPSLEHAKAVCDSLDLPFGLARSMFATVGGRPAQSERMHWQLAIRFCSECLACFVHRAAFQDRRVTKCALHGCELLDACPHCLSPIDPLCVQAWTCSSCQGPLVETGRDWPVQYREGRGGVLPERPLLKSSPQAVMGGWSHVDRRRVVQEAYEEHSALCSSLLGHHLDCAPREREALNARVAPVWFDCPLAALAIFTGTQLAFAAQCTDGAWMPPRPHIGSAQALSFLEGALMATPESEHGPATRLFTRMWFAEALKSFAHAVETGRDSALWMPSPDPRLDSGGVKLPEPAEHELVGLVAQAARGCRLQQRANRQAQAGVSAA